MGAVTEMSLRARGVTFVWSGEGKLHARGPASLREVVAAEVARRASRLRELPAANGQYGACDCCGEPLEPYRAGMCALCCAARRKAVGL